MSGVSWCFLQGLIAWRPGKLAKGTLRITLGLVLRTLGQGLVFLIVARVLGAATYGAYAATLALAMMLGTFTGLGAPILMLRDTARNHDVLADSWGHLVATWLVTAPLLLLVLALVSRMLLPAGIDWLAVLCLGIAEIVCAPIALAAAQVYQAHERAGRMAHLLVVPALLRLAAALPLLLFVDTPGNVRLTLWSLAYLLAAVASLGYSLAMLRRDFGLQVTARWHELPRLLKEGWPFSVSGAAQKVYMDIDKLMLARLGTLGAAGGYSAAYRVVDMASLPLASFFTAVTPRMMREGKNGLSHVNRYMLRLLPVPLFYAISVAGALYVLADLLPWLLGPSFAPAVEILRWLILLPVLVLVRRFLLSANFCVERQRFGMSIILLGAGVNVVLNLWWIPLWSWQGALWATYAAEGSMIVALLIAQARHVTE